MSYATVKKGRMIAAKKGVCKTMIYSYLALLTGAVIAVMVAINGELSILTGVFVTTAIIHVVGTAFAYLSVRASGRRVRIPKGTPLWLFLGGAIGILTTVFDNSAYGKISMTAMMALELLGQSVTALVVDRTGLFGMQRRKFEKTTLIGLAFAAVGIGLMLRQVSGAALVAIFLSFGAGVTVVTSRSVNAALGEKIGEMQCSFVNHLVGLPISIVLALALGGGALSLPTLFSGRPWVYCGGILGVATVLLCNVTVPKLSAFRLTLLSFVGQVFTGVVLDVFFKTGFDRVTFLGGIIIAAGIAVNMLCEKAKENKTRNARR